MNVSKRQPQKPAFQQQFVVKYGPPNLDNGAEALSSTFIANSNPDCTTDSAIFLTSTGTDNSLASVGAYFDFVVSMPAILAAVLFD